MDMEQAWIGHENVTRRILRAGGAELKPDQKAAITRVVAQIGSHCLDTDEQADPIEYDDGTVDMQIGLIEGINAGTKTVRMVAYSQDTPNGKAWGEFRVRIHEWDVCD